MKREYKTDFKELDKIQLSVISPTLEGFPDLDWGLQAMVKKTENGVEITNRNVPKNAKLHNVKNDADVVRYLSENSDPYWATQPKFVPKQLPYLFKTMPKTADIDVQALDIEKDGEFTFFLIGLKSKAQKGEIVPFESVMFGRDLGDVQVYFHRLFVYRLDMMRNDYFLEVTLSYHRLKKDARLWLKIPVPDWKAESEDKDVSYWENKIIDKLQAWKDPKMMDAGELKTALYLEMFGKRTDKEFDPTTKAYEKFTQLKSIYVKTENYMPLSVLSVFLAFGFWYHTYQCPYESIFDQLYGTCFNNWNNIWEKYFDPVK